MKLKLIRTDKGNNYTTGKLYIDEEVFCDTLEDLDRGLSDDMTLEEISKIKVKGETAIPTGEYQIDMDTVSPKYSTSDFMKKNANGGRVPRLQNVKGFDGILIHTGNTIADTDGCILVGVLSGKGYISSSRATFEKLYPILQKANENKEMISILIS